MSIRELARIFGLIYAQVDSIERELRQAILSGLEIERLIYSFPKIAEPDTVRLKEEVISSLGLEEKDLLEAIRRSLRGGGRRVVGGRRCAIVLVSPLPDAIAGEVNGLVGSSGGRVKAFDATSYPLASVAEVLEHDPDCVIFLSVREEGTSLERIMIAGSENPDELNEMIALSLLGSNEIGLLAEIIGSLSEGRKDMWALYCSGSDEGVHECIGVLRDLMRGLGFSY